MKGRFASLTTRANNLNTRDEFVWYAPANLRWMDFDAFGHLCHASLPAVIDSVLHRFLVEEIGLPCQSGLPSAVAYETSFRFFAPVFPDEAMEVGVVVGDILEGSANFHCGLFEHSEQSTRACGELTYIVAIPESMEPVGFDETQRKRLLTYSLRGDKS